MTYKDIVQGVVQDGITAWGKAVLYYFLLS